MAVSGRLADTQAVGRPCAWEDNLFAFHAAHNCPTWLVDAATQSRGDWLATASLFAAWIESEDSTGRHLEAYGIPMQMMA